MTELSIVFKMTAATPQEPTDAPVCCLCGGRVERVQIKDHLTYSRTGKGLLIRILVPLVT